MKFSTVMFQDGNNTGIEVPAGVVEALAAGKRPAVVVDVNGYRYRSTVAPMGGKFLIPFSAERRKEIARLLEGSGEPLKGAELASRFEVSRQVIVQDLALLRAETLTFLLYCWRDSHSGGYSKNKIPHGNFFAIGKIAHFPNRRITQSHLHKPAYRILYKVEVARRG